MALLCPLLTLYLLAVFGRIILSWFPVSPGSFMSSLFSVLYTVTEPVLGRLRRVIPSIGMFDLSPLVVVFGISIIQQSIGCGRLF